MIQITNIRTSQIPPIERLTASVLVMFDVVGVILPDMVVQIYATGRSDSLDIAIPKEEVELAINKHSGYTATIDLQAGSFFLVSFCPRTKTDGVPDPEIEGQEWVAFCTVVEVTTHAIQPQSHSDAPTTPVINSVEPHQATLEHEGKIIIRWVGSMFDQCHFMWQDKPPYWHEEEIEFDPPSTTGSFVVSPAYQGHNYSFKVQACKTKLIGLNRCSPFTTETGLVMPQNTHSLRVFLQLSRAHLNPGIRSLGASVLGNGVRSMMRL